MNPVGDLGQEGFFPGWGRGSGRCLFLLFPYHVHRLGDHKDGGGDDQEIHQSPDKHPAAQGRTANGTPAASTVADFRAIVIPAENP